MIDPWTWWRTSGVLVAFFPRGAGRPPGAVVRSCDWGHVLESPCGGLGVGYVIGIGLSNSTSLAQHYAMTQGPASHRVAGIPTCMHALKASRRFEPRSLDSESRVLTVTPRGQVKESISLTSLY